ncbi:MAG: hypothetical protein ACKER6_01425 [Candidatus Hodgkinia cicadicola]
MRPSALTTLEYIKLTKHLSWRQRRMERELGPRLKATRALGDLSENAEHQSTKAEVKANNSKIEQLRRILGRSEAIMGRGPEGRIGFNTAAVLRSLDGQLSTLTVLSNSQIEHENGRVALISADVGRFLGRKVGDTILLPRAMSLEAHKIIYIAVW